MALELPPAIVIFVTRSSATAALVKRDGARQNAPMKGDADIHTVLNDVLTEQLTAINRYFIHHKMCRHWGYQRLSEKKRHESIRQMKDADYLIERVLLLEGTPNLQRLSPIQAGEDPVEQNEIDLSKELEAVKQLNTAIALTASKGDNATRALLERILVGREEAVDWLQAQAHQVKEVGRELYLAEQIHEEEG